MKSKIFVAIILVLLIVGGLAGVKAKQIQKLVDSSKSVAQPPESVSTAVVRQEKWRGTLSAIGSVTAVQGVNLTPEIAGTVRVISFESGAVVAQGDVLVRLDTSIEEAQLRALEAQTELAKINIVRERTLRSDNMVSQAELDAAEATLKQNQANADAIRATIEKKIIRAPFAGRLGLRLINLGQYLDAGKPIVSLQSLTPVYGDFSLPQQNLAQLKPGMQVRLMTDAYPGRQFDGTLMAMNPEIDATTRSVGLRAAFANSDQTLRPGMYARMEVLLADEKSVLVIPATSVLSAPFGDSVYVIEAKPDADSEKSGLVVRQQFVHTGQARGDFLVVESGVKEGDRIVNAGLFKLRNGMAVVENNVLVPKSAESPQPADN
jgi:membrane fusion protein, multidrug efflux system